MKGKIKRYSALLLMQHRAVVNGKSNTRRHCTRSVYTFTARNAREALRKAERIGRNEECIWPAGQSIGGVSPCYDAHWEFVGVIQLIHLGPECSDGEVWCETVVLNEPMERRRQLVPSTSELQAIKEESRERGPTTPRTLRRVPRRK